jgi:hypothetical protein
MRPGLVCAMPHAICRTWGPRDRKENIVGSSSAGCMSRLDQSMLSEASRGGVPVFRRPSGRPIASSRSARRTEGLSPIRPPGRDTSPIWMTPRRNVPVVRTTAEPEPLRHRPGARHRSRSPARRRSATSPSITSRFACSQQPRGSPVGTACGPIACAARAPQGPFAGSAGGTGCRTCRPPDPSPTKRVDLSHEVALAQAADRRVAGHHADPAHDSVTRAVDAPARAAAQAASTPAWPPPITITSNRSCFT